MGTCLESKIGLRGTFRRRLSPDEVARHCGRGSEIPLLSNRLVPLALSQSPGIPLTVPQSRLRAPHSLQCRCMVQQAGRNLQSQVLPARPPSNYDVVEGLPLVGLWERAGCFQALYGERTVQMCSPFPHATPKARRPILLPHLRAAKGLASARRSRCVREREQQVVVRFRTTVRTRQRLVVHKKLQNRWRRPLGALCCVRWGPS